MSTKYRTCTENGHQHTYVATWTQCPACYPEAARHQMERQSREQNALEVAKKTAAIALKSGADVLVAFDAGMRVYDAMMTDSVREESVNVV